MRLSQKKKMDPANASNSVAGGVGACVRPCTPWDYYKAITKILISPTCPITPELATLHKNWAFAALQTMQHKHDTSLLYLKLGAAVSPHKCFREWKQMMINLALGSPGHEVNNYDKPTNPTREDLTIPWSYCS